MGEEYDRLINELEDLRVIASSINDIVTESQSDFDAAEKNVHETVVIQKEGVKMIETAKKKSIKNKLIIGGIIAAGGVAVGAMSLLPSAVPALLGIGIAGGIVAASATKFSLKK